MERSKKDGLTKEKLTFSNYRKYSKIKYISHEYKEIYKKSNLYNYIKNSFFYLKHYEFTETNVHKLDKIKLDNKLWFLKNTSIYTYGGYDVFPIIANNNMITNIKTAIEDMKKYNKYEHDAIFVLQKGVQEPMLINNKKFDIRVYYLAMSVNDKISFFVNKYCILRKSTANYNNNSTERAIQLTNTTFQKDKGELDDLTELFCEEHKLYYLFPKILKLVQKLSKIYANVLKTQKPNLDLYGIDIMFDTSENIYLLEVNITPAIYVEKEQVVKLHKNIETYLFKNFLENTFEKLANRKIQKKSFGEYIKCY